MFKLNHDSGFTLLQVLLAISMLSCAVIFFGFSSQTVQKDSKADQSILRTMHFISGAQNYFLQNKRWPGLHCVGAVEEISASHIYTGKLSANSWGQSYSTSCRILYDGVELLVVEQKVDEGWADYMVGILPSSFVGITENGLSLVTTFVAQPGTEPGRLSLHSSSSAQPIKIPKPQCPEGKNAQLFYPLNEFCAPEEMHAYSLNISADADEWRLSPRYQSYTAMMSTAMTSEAGFVTANISDWKSLSVKQCHAASSSVQWMAGCF